MEYLPYVRDRGYMDWKEKELKNQAVILRVKCQAVGLQRVHCKVMAKPLNPIWIVILGIRQGICVSSVVCMVHVCECAGAVTCFEHVEARAGHWVLCFIFRRLIALKQGLPLN